MDKKVLVLPKINYPEDLKALSTEELIQLCDELRANLIEVISDVGGHLSSSLGVVELTVALHRVFDTPKDKIVWDVGHQAYIHKMLTGRRDKLQSIRHYRGISGFLKRAESKYDCYGAGHASTSLSAAFGMAKARDLKKEDYKVVAVIGDGALTGGMAYEAINNVGNSRCDLLIILNDNRMSISPNVGAINRYLTNFTSTPLYHRFRQDVKKGLERIPHVGNKLSFLARRIEESAKYLMTPGTLFEALGCAYYGPIDGHDLPELLSVMKRMKELKGPVLLHILTKKGKGYPPAEEDSEGYHGVKPFNHEIGVVKSVSKSPTYQDIFGKTLLELGGLDKRVIGITAAMPTGTGIIPFAEAFPDRYFDVGIAEQHAVVFSCGMATQGFIPYCAIYSTFLQRAYDPVVHDASIQNLPVVFCMDRSGLAGEDGPTHHGSFDLSFLRHVPGIIISAPRDGRELRNLMFTALKTKSPFAIRYPKDTTEPVPEEETFSEIEIGSWEILEEGRDICILACGSMVKESLNALKILRLTNINPRIVNCRFIKPLDEKMLSDCIIKFNAILIVEENAAAGGFGSGILEWIAESGNHFPKIKILGIPDRFIQHGKRAELLKEAGLDYESIAESAEAVLSSIISKKSKNHIIFVK